MTSSAKQTDSNPRYSRRWVLAIGGVMVLAGWVMILMLNRWYFTTAVFFLFTAWVGLVLTAWYLSQAGWTAAEEDEGDDFWKPIGRRAELEREKRSLLKAIKEIEFDHQMGKMSDEDAEELTRFYRGRAIEVIKALETGGAEADSVAGEIDRDLKARLAVTAGMKQRNRKDKAEDAFADEHPDEGSGQDGSEGESAGAKSAGATSAGSKSAGSKSAGAKSAGSKSAGSKSAGPESASAESAGSKEDSP